MKVTNDIHYIGVNDREIDLFEGQYRVKNGMAYNSYAVTDEKTAVIDTVDARFTHEWLDNVDTVLDGRPADYLIVQHMEPDHSANILNFMKLHPETTVVATAKAFAMMEQFFGTDFADNRIVAGEGDTLCLGKHTLTFVTAPMVHWPEVMVTYDSTDKVLFSADGFGKFGALDAEEDWADEARRYYFGIVGKYGAQVQALLKKAAGLDISKSHAVKYVPENGKMRLPFGALGGVGEKAAWAIYEAAQRGNFVSREDFQIEAGVSKTIIQNLADLGAMNDLPDTNQISMF